MTVLSKFSIPMTVTTIKSSLAIFHILYTIYGATPPSKSSDEDMNKANDYLSDHEIEEEKMFDFTSLKGKIMNQIGSNIFQCLTWDLYLYDAFVKHNIVSHNYFTNTQIIGM